jgi:activator of HSP90 ATPase
MQLFFDLQRIVFSIFSGFFKESEYILRNTTLKRINKQIDKQGKQKYEPARSN